MNTKANTMREATWEFRVYAWREREGERITVGEGQRNGEDPKSQVFLINNVDLSLFHQFTRNRKKKKNRRILKSNLLFWIHSLFQTIFADQIPTAHCLWTARSDFGSTLRSSSNDLKFFEHHIRASQWYVRLQAEIATLSSFRFVCHF